MGVKPRCSPFAVAQNLIWTSRARTWILHIISGYVMKVICWQWARWNNWLSRFNGEDRGVARNDSAVLYIFYTVQCRVPSSVWVCMWEYRKRYSFCSRDVTWGQQPTPHLGTFPALCCNQPPITSAISLASSTTHWWFIPYMSTVPDSPDFRYSACPAVPN